MTQPRTSTPRPVWNPDVSNLFDFYQQWDEVPDSAPFDNAFKVQWEMFLRHVATDEPFVHDFMEGAKGVQLAELALRSWADRRWVDVPVLALADEGNNERGKGNVARRSAAAR